MLYSIRTLKNTSISEITECFNLSFSDYVVPFSLTEQQLNEKMKRDSVQLKFSAGAYLNNKLIGFILHGVGVVNGKKRAYNAGTGVIPTARGQQLTTKLYKFIIPILCSNSVENIQLEVISNNHPAIKTYQNTGFEKVRDLYCFKGSVDNKSANSNIEIKELHIYNWDALQLFWDTTPSWQNAILAINSTIENLVAFGAYNNNLLIGYLVYNPGNKQIQQIAVDKNCRNKGVGTELVLHITAKYGNELSLVNIDSNAASALNFMKHLKLENTVNQYEMLLDLYSTQFFK